MGLFFLVITLLYASSISEHLKQTAYSLMTDFTVLRSSTLYREKMNGNVCLPQVVGDKNFLSVHKILNLA